MKRAHSLFGGNVQGVGFRFSAVELATRYGLTGWVRNLGDGRVELVVEGKEPALLSFFDELTAMMSRQIRDKQISWEPATGEFVAFQIKY